MRIFFLFVLLLSQALSAFSQNTELCILQTGDVHGALFSHDFKTGQALPYGIDRFSSYVTQMRSLYGNNLLLFDAGDNLQGQPPMYYYNYVDTLDTHLWARVMNCLPLDAAAVGNHDIEAGHAVYDKLYAACTFPILAANIVREETQEPYFVPYTVWEREGFKIAVLGLTTPFIPQWLPEHLWLGMEFLKLEESARLWASRIIEKEQPDILIGLFHTGAGEVDGGSGENGALAIAAKVPGFDLIYCGHDHRARAEKVAGPGGDSVWLVNAGANMRQVSEVKIRLARRPDGSVDKEVTGSLLQVSEMEIDPDWRDTFADDFNQVTAYVSSSVGILETPIRGADALAGPSAFVDWIHQVQLERTGAQISFAAPLSVSADIPAGMLTVGDFFSWYPYENSLYVIEMSGYEIKNYLEYSYDGWIGGRRTPSYNFDSAAGIFYKVDKTKRLGERVSIASLSNGAPFMETETYRVALNSYRANGGGGHLEEGAGIPKEELAARVRWRGTGDFREDLIQWVRSRGSFSPAPIGAWRFVGAE